MSLRCRPLINHLSFNREPDLPIDPETGEPMEAEVPNDVSPR